MLFRRTLYALCAATSLALVAAPAQAAGKCTAAPAKPALRAVWTSSGGPSFTLAAAKGGSPATSMRWTASYFNPSTLQWSNYSAWKTLTASPSPKKVLNVAPSPGKSLINMVAVAANKCGASAQQRLEVPLLTAAALVAKPTLAASVPVRVGEIPFDAIAGAATSGLPLTLTSLTANTCGTNLVTRKLQLMSAGECRIRISERNAVISLPNPDIELSLALVADIPALPTAARDRTDERSGFQVHVVYVTPRGSSTHNFAADGHLDLWVALAQDWMKRRIARTFAFDTAEGKLDVTTLPSSYSIDDMRARSGAETTGSEALLGALADEFAQANGSPVPGKNLLFVIDGELSPGICGYADKPGTLALVTATAPGCWTGDDDFIAQAHGLNWMSATIIHELLHNVGVSHLCTDASDIMLGDGCAQTEAAGVLTLDATGTHYLGGAGAALDIRTIKVWADGSGTRHIAADGLCYVGEACALPQLWWSAGDQTLALQQLVNGTWQTVARFTSRRDAVASPNYPYTYDVIVTPSGVGAMTYRYRLEPTAGWSEHLEAPFTVAVPY